MLTSTINVTHTPYSPTQSRVRFLLEMNKQVTTRACFCHVNKESVCVTVSACIQRDNGVQCRSCLMSALCFSSDMIRSRCTLLVHAHRPACIHGGGQRAQAIPVPRCTVILVSLKPNSITLSGSRLVRSWSRTCLRPASNQSRTRQRNGIWSLMCDVVCKR